jgi:hypothetical protein
MDTHLTAHPGLCFRDGNIALLAGGCYFLLHRGFLARHSPVLAHAFQIHDGNCSDHFRGQPVIEMQDSAEDMAFFLLALYDGTYVIPTSVQISKEKNILVSVKLSSQE